MENRFGLPGINTDNPRPLNEGDKSHSFQCYTNSPLRGFPGTKSYFDQFQLKLGISDTQRSASNMERGSQRPTPIKSIIDSYQGFISKMKFSTNSLLLLRSEKNSTSS